MVQQIHEMNKVADFFVAPVMVQSTDVLVGQPITESEGVYVYKIVNVLKLTDKFRMFTISRRRC